MIHVEDFLTSHGIHYISREHPPLFTYEDEQKYCRDFSGLICKNLFLKGKKTGQYFLVILPSAKRADLKKIEGIIGEKKMQFGSAEALQEKLGLEPGSVPPFGVLNDMNHEVAMYIDREVYDAEIVNFHPNRNTASLEISGEMFRKFLEMMENKVEVIDL